MNSESVDCRKVEYGKGMERVGDFCFDDAFGYIYVWIPGRSGPDAIQIQKGGSGGPRIWAWDGNEDKPTLTPSIHCTGIWHGYLTNGRLVSC